MSKIDTSNQTGLKRLCYNCQHILLDAGWGGTSVTPGDGATFMCAKGHWNLFGGGMYSDHDPKLGGLRECIEYADKCPQYEHSDEATRLGIIDPHQGTSTHVHEGVVTRD